MLIDRYVILVIRDRNSNPQPPNGRTLPTSLDLAPLMIKWVKFMSTPTSGQWPLHCAHGFDTLYHTCIFPIFQIKVLKSINNILVKMD